MVDIIRVYECVECEGRGRTPEEVRHLVTCADPSEVRALEFEVGGGDELGLGLGTRRTPPPDRPRGAGGAGASDEPGGSPGQ